VLFFYSAPDTTRDVNGYVCIKLELYLSLEKMTFAVVEIPLLSHHWYLPNANWGVKLSHRQLSELMLPQPLNITNYKS
jgi:hypothetical protein